MKFANNSANTNGRASTLIAYDGPCLFFSLHVHAGSGGGAYVMLFDTRTLPTSGTRPKRVWQVVESTSFDHETTNGVPLQNGCVVACSSTEFEYTALDALPLMDVVFYIPPPNLPPKTDPITAATLEPATKPAPPPQRPPPASTPAGRPAPTSKPLKATVAALLAGFLTLCCSSAWAASSTTPGNTGGGTVGVKTQGVSVVTSATSINFVTGSNTLVLVTNAAGVVSVQVNATATGSGGSTQDVARTVGTLTVTNPVTGTGFRQSSVRASRGLLFGDSMTAAGVYAGYVGLDYYLLSPGDVQMGTVISNQAIGGQNVAQQKAIWEADTNKLSYDWFGIQLGINGSLNINDDITNMLYQLQGLVNSVASQKKPGAAIVLATMTPLREWINAYYDPTNGAGATFAGIVYTNWLNANAAIMGSTTNAITNVTFRTQRHTVALDNGNGFLSPLYNPSLDGYHTDNRGRQVAAAAYRQILNEAGYLENEKALDYSSPWRTDGTNTVQTQGSNVFTLGRVTIGSLPGSGSIVAHIDGLLFATNAGGSGVTSINSQTGNTQTINSSTNGGFPLVTSSGNIHTINLPWAGPGFSGSIHSNDWNRFNAGYITNVQAIAYVATNGNDATAVLSMERRPFLTLSNAIFSVRTNGGLVKIGPGRFRSPPPLLLVTDHTNNPGTARLVFQGSGRPFPTTNNNFSTLIEDGTTTVLEGPFLINRPNVEVTDLGIDCGKVVCTNYFSAAAQEGLLWYTFQQENYTTNTINFNAVAKRITVLSYETNSLCHAVVMENVVDGIMEDIWTCGATHGVVIKGYRVQASRITAQGHSTDGFIIKANDYAAPGRRAGYEGTGIDGNGSITIAGLLIRPLRNIGDTPGLTFDTVESTTTHMSMINVTGYCYFGTRDMVILNSQATWIIAGVNIDCAGYKWGTGAGTISKTGTFGSVYVNGTSQ